jgi:hypothetical protein
MIGAGVSAIDETSGILYWISGELFRRQFVLCVITLRTHTSYSRAAPGGYPVNYTLNVYNLVGTNLADATTASTVPFCCFGGCQPPATQPICPWSLEFNNGA